MLRVLCLGYGVLSVNPRPVKLAIAYLTKISWNYIQYNKYRDAFIFLQIERKNQKQKIHSKYHVTLREKIEQVIKLNPSHSLLYKIKILHEELHIALPLSTKDLWRFLVNTNNEDSLFLFFKSAPSSSFFPSFSLFFPFQFYSLFFLSI